MKVAVAILGLLLALPARGGDLPALAILSQGELRQLAEDLGASVTHKGVIPATALGPLGFDIAMGISATGLRHGGVFARAGNREADTLFVPKVQLSKGMPFGLDLGAFVGLASNVDAAVVGVDLRYAIVNDALAMPAVGLRLSGTRLGEVGGLRMSTAAADVLVSKRLALVTPYIGAGTVRTRAQVSGDALAGESFNRNRVLVGLNVGTVLFNLAVEAEKLGDNTSLSAKAGWRF